GDNCLSFRTVGAALALIIDASGHRAPAYAQGVGLRRRKRQQAVVVVVGVAEGDEAFVATTVVPAQLEPGQTGGDAIVQDALQIFDWVIVAEFLPVTPAEKIGRRQLFGIADDNRLATTGNGPDRIPGGEL